MSHNVTKLNGQEPSAGGVVTQTLADLSDVSGPFTDKYTLGYSSGWTALSPPATRRIPIISWQTDTSFGTSVYNYGSNDNVIWRNQHFVIEDANYVSRVTASGSLVPVATSAWTQYFTLKTTGLNGRTILCEATHQASNLTGSETIEYQWGVGSSNLATFTPIGGKAQQTQHYTTTALGIYTVGASNINLALKVTAVSGSVSIFNGASALTSSLQLSILD